MPQVFKVEPYWVYFWANENEPLAGTRPYCGGRAYCKWTEGMDNESGEMPAL